MLKYIVTLLAIIVLMVSITIAQQNTITPLGQGDILLSKPQRQGLYAWFVARAPSYGSSTWWNLAGFSHGALSGFNGTATSGWNSTSRKGGVGQLNFDGTDDTVSVTAPNVSGGAGTFDFRINVPFTITFWMNTTSASTARSLIGKQSTGSPPTGYFVRMELGKIQFGINDVSFNSIIVTTGTTWNDGVWHAVAAVYNGATIGDISTLAVYVDGTPQSLSPTSNAPINSAIHTGPSVPLFISPTTGVTPFVGALDDIRVYGVVLSQAVITEIADSEISLVSPLSQQPFISYAIAAAGAKVKQKRRME